MPIWFIAPHVTILVWKATKEKSLCGFDKNRDHIMAQTKEKILCGFDKKHDHIMAQTLNLGTCTYSPKSQKRGFPKEFSTPINHDYRQLTNKLH